VRETKDTVVFFKVFLPIYTKVVTITTKLVEHLERFKYLQVKALVYHLNSQNTLQYLHTCTKTHLG
jgi:hypothetical protein